MLALFFNLAAYGIVLVMGVIIIAGLVALWRTIPLMGGVVTLLLVGTLVWMWDRMRHEREIGGSDYRRDGADPPRGPAEARRRWW